MKPSKLDWRLDGESFLEAVNNMGELNSMVWTAIQTAKQCQPTYFKGRRKIGMWDNQLAVFENNCNCFAADAVYIRQISILSSKTVRTKDEQLQLCLAGVDCLANLKAGNKKVGINRRVSCSLLLAQSYRHGERLQVSNAANVRAAGMVCSAQMFAKLKRYSKMCNHR